LAPAVGQDERGCIDEAAAMGVVELRVRQDAQASGTELYDPPLGP
jgi:hypothetical protein